MFEEWKKNCLHNFILCLRLQNVNASKLTQTYGIPGIYLKTHANIKISTSIIPFIGKDEHFSLGSHFCLNKRSMERWLLIAQVNNLTTNDKHLVLTRFWLFPVHAEIFPGAFQSCYLTNYWKKINTFKSNEPSKISLNIHVLRLTI